MIQLAGSGTDGLSEDQKAFLGGDSGVGYEARQRTCDHLHRDRKP